MKKIWNEKYYYIRDDIKTSPDSNGRPIITVCLIKVSGDIGRGLAICSDLDQPCKKVGRSIARTRALYALAQEKNWCEMKRGDKIPLMAFIDGFYKSTYNPELTDYEQKLFNTKNEELFYEEMDEIKFNSRGI